MSPLSPSSQDISVNQPHFTLSDSQPHITISSHYKSHHSLPQDIAFHTHSSTTTKLQGNLFSQTPLSKTGTQNRGALSKHSQQSKHQNYGRHPRPIRHLPR